MATTHEEKLLWNSQLVIWLHYMPFISPLSLTYHAKSAAVYSTIEKDERIVCGGLEREREKTGVWGENAVPSFHVQ